MSLSAQAVLSRRCGGRGVPKTNKLFSGNRLPLETPSSMEDHMFFLDSSLLRGRVGELLLPVDLWL